MANVKFLKGLKTLAYTYNMSSNKNWSISIWTSCSYNKGENEIW